MFMLKSIFGKIWGDQDNVELIQIPAGSLFLVRPSTVKGSRECIYKDAVATIRRTPTEFNYQLVVTRAYDEGEQQLLDEDEEGDDERSFLVDERLEFKSGEGPEGEPTFGWRDLTGDSDDRLEFVMDGEQVNSVTRSIFEVTYLQCVYERKFQRSHEAASDADLEALKPKGAKKEAAAAAVTTPTAAADKGKGKSAGKKSDTPAAPAKPLVPAAPTESFPVEGEPDILLETTADLYLYDQSSGLFMSQEKGIKAQVAEAGQFLYWLSISSTTSDRRWLSQRLDGSMNVNFASDSLSSVWNYFDAQRRCYSWLLRFRDKEDYEAWQRGFARLMWQTLNEEKWEKVKPDEQQYALDAYEDDVEMTEAGAPAGEEEEDNSEDERAVDRYIRDDERGAREASASLMEEVEEEDERDDAKNVGDAPAAMPVEAGEQERNSQLAVGYKFDRSFVVRGNRIGVFKHTDDVSGRRTRVSASASIQTNLPLPCSRRTKSNSPLQSTTSAPPLAAPSTRAKSCSTTKTRQW